MEIVRKGKPYYYYDLTCPKCHSVIRVGESELHYYEDCYDLEMAETDSPCPNCMARYINVPKHELEKYRVGEKKEEEQKKEEPNTKHRSVLRFFTHLYK